VSQTLKRIITTARGVQEILCRYSCRAKAEDLFDVAKPVDWGTSAVAGVLIFFALVEVVARSGAARRIVLWGGVGGGFLGYSTVRFLLCVGVEVSFFAQTLQQLVHRGRPM